MLIHKAHLKFTHKKSSRVI